MENTGKIIMVRITFWPELSAVMIILINNRKLFIFKIVLIFYYKIFSELPYSVDVR